MQIVQVVSSLVQIQNQAISDLLVSMLVCLQDDVIDHQFPSEWHTILDFLTFQHFKTFF